MKKTSVLALAALFLSVGAVQDANATYCTNGATNYPKCDNNKPPAPPPPAPAPAPAPAPSKTWNTNKNQNKNQNTNQAQAKAQAEADAAAQAKAEQQQRQQQQQAQQQRQQQDQANLQTLEGSGNSKSKNDNSLAVGGDTVNSRSSMWVLPAPVFTPPLPQIADCPSANVDQMAVAGLWNGFSYAKASVNTDNCTAIILYNQYVSTCKYHSAQQVLNLLSSKVLPGFEKSDVALFDLNKRECDALNAPIPPQVPEYFPLPPAPAASKPPAKVVPCPKGQKRNSKGVCFTPKPPCEEGKVLACTLKKSTPSVAKQ
jgi:hypothetical protein